MLHNLIFIQFWAKMFKMIRPKKDVQPSWGLNFLFKSRSSNEYGATRRYNVAAGTQRNHSTQS